MKRKLTLSSEEEVRDKAKKDIVAFVEKRLLRGEETAQKNIIEVFKKPPYYLSQGTIVNHLSYLVDKRKLSTSYKNGHRYYGPPRIPLPIKFGVATSLAVITVFTILNQILSKEVIARFYFMELPENQSSLTFFPIMIYMLSGIVFTSIAWYISLKKSKTI